MLDPQNRQLLFELLRPPDGYRLDRAVGTTYSLDLLALLVTPLAFTLFDWETQEGRITASPFALLESLRRYADQIKVFCQAGQIYVPQRKRRLFAYLEQSVVEVLPPDVDGVFHPKLWLLRFAPAGKLAGSALPITYRLLCPSRNLTFDRSWDTMLVLEGDYPPRGRRRKENKGLGDFVRRFPELAVRDVDPADRAKIAEMASELERVAFEPPEEFDEVHFWPLGLDDDAEWPFDDEIDRLLVISPFLSAEILEELSDVGDDHLLVSRVESLREINPSVLKRFDAIFTLDPTAESEPGENEPDVDDQSDASASPSASNEISAADPDAADTVSAESVADEPVLIEDQGDEDHEEQGANTKPGPTLSGLHAKVYVADSGPYGRVWTGSANATLAAFSKNVEILIELVGANEVCGIDGVLDPEGQGAGFWKLLQPYIPPGETETSTTQAELEAQRRLDRFQKQVAASPLTLTVTAAEEDSETFQLDLRLADNKALDLGRLANAGCRPVTLKPHWERQIKRSGTLATFDGVPFESITSFVVFHATVEVNGARDERRFVVNTQLEGAPADRQQRMLLAMLKNSQQVMRYLLMLLADDGWDARQAIEDIHGDADEDEDEPGKGSTNGAPRRSLELPLLEPLLRALAKNPGKLDGIAQLMTDLSRTPEGSALIPEGFEEVWTPIWQARQEKES